MLRMTIEGVGFDRLRQTVVVLKDWDGRKLLPIWIGANEAKSIALELEGATPPRPLSHDLLMSCLRLREARVVRVVINDLQDSTFYATLDIDTPQGIKHIDARPSDAIAVAVRAKCPVFVSGGALDALVEINEAGTLEVDSEEAAQQAAELDLLTESGFNPKSSNESAGQDDEMARFKRLIGEVDL